MRFKCIDCKESFIIEHPSPISFKHCPRCGRMMWGTLYSDLKGYLNHKHPIPDEKVCTDSYCRPSVSHESFRHFQAKFADEFDTPNAEMARESKEMRATRHHIPTIKMLINGEWVKR